MNIWLSHREVRELLGTVLIAEDNALVRESLCHVLRERGYTVIEAENGEIALERIVDGNIDLAIIDIMMPSMGGLELRQAIDERVPPIPTILVTGQWYMALEIDGMLNQTQELG